MRVAVAEDGALFREGLLLLLEAAGYDVVGCVDNGDALLTVVADTAVDVAILDIRMPPGPEGGLVTAARIRQRSPGTGLLLLSLHAETDYLIRVLGIGTKGVGYRLKEHVAGVQELSDTVDRIASGGIVVEPALVRRLVESPVSLTDSPIALLGECQLDVLRLVAEGRANNAIADELSVSVKVVEKHIASIFTKLRLPCDSTLHHRRILAVLAYLREAKISG